MRLNNRYSPTFYTKCFYTKYRDQRLNNFFMTHSPLHCYHITYWSLYILCTYYIQYYVLPLTVREGRDHCSWLHIERESTHQTNTRTTSHSYKVDNVNNTPNNVTILSYYVLDLIMIVKTEYICLYNFTRCCPCTCTGVIGCYSPHVAMSINYFVNLTILLIAKCD